MTTHSEADNAQALARYKKDQAKLKIKTARARVRAKQDALNDGKKLADPKKLTLELYRQLPDKVRRDLLLMPIMLGMAIDNAERQDRIEDQHGEMVRPEIDPQLGKSLADSAALVVQSWDELMMRQRTAHNVVKDAQYILRSAKAENHRQIILAVSRAVLHQVEEGVHAAPDSQAVLVAMTFIDTAQNHDGDGFWNYDGATVVSNANHLIEAARIRGYL